MIRRPLLKLCWLISALLLVVTFPAYADPITRIATYNLNQLNSDLRVVRKNHIKDVIQVLDADIIALQEVGDRTALERVFNKNKWTLFLDDESSDSENVALAIRKPIKLLSRNTLPDTNASNANDSDFLYPSPSLNSLFPGRKDVLVARLQLSDNTEIHVLVVDAPERNTQRTESDKLKAQAAVALIKKLEREFDDKPFILLGDFNDSPDDLMLNILESGNPAAKAAMENHTGEFLINITEPLFNNNHVTTGREKDNISHNRIDTIDPNTRERNFTNRAISSHTGDNLFDQILISPQVKPYYVMNSVSIFSSPIALKGNRKTIASDHLPVYADFVFAKPRIPEELPNIPRIVRALINPRGQDSGKETVVIRNDSAKEVSLDNWSLTDRAGNKHRLSGMLASEKELVVALPKGQLPLNNNGDEINLTDSNNKLIDNVIYIGEQVHEGYYTTFDLWKH